MNSKKAKNVQPQWYSKIMQKRSLFMSCNQSFFNDFDNDFSGINNNEIFFNNGFDNFADANSFFNPPLTAEWFQRGYREGFQDGFRQGERARRRRCCSI